jgi:hypothetical protein
MLSEIGQTLGQVWLKILAEGVKFLMGVLEDMRYWKTE